MTSLIEFSFVNLSIKENYLILDSLLYGCVNTLGFSKSYSNDFRFSVSEFDLIQMLKFENFDLYSIKLYKGQVRNSVQLLVYIF